MNVTLGAGPVAVTMHPLVYASQRNELHFHFNGTWALTFRRLDDGRFDIELAEGVNATDAAREFIRECKFILGGKP